jgi:hypothetical protein
MQNFSKRTKIIAFCILHFAICILILSCFNPFSPSVIGPGALKPIAPQVDPDSVLYNFKYAYENRDSVVYENCLDEHFTFTYWDQLKVGEAIEETEFTLSQDLKATKDLFRTFEEIRLDEWKIDFLPDTTVGEELWKGRNVEFHLSVWDIDGEYQSMEANGFAEFYFRRSEKDNLWRIVHWIDRSNR